MKDSFTVSVSVTSFGDYVRHVKLLPLECVPLFAFNETRNWPIGAVPPLGDLSRLRRYVKEVE